MRERVTSVLEVVSLVSVVAGVAVLFGGGWAMVVGGVVGLAVSALVTR